MGLVNMSLIEYRKLFTNRAKLCFPAILSRIVVHVHETATSSSGKASGQKEKHIIWYHHSRAHFSCEM